MGFQKFRRGDEVLFDFYPVQGTLQAAPLIVVAGISTDRVKRIRGQGDKARFGQSPGHVLDIGVESPIFVNYQNDGCFTG